MTILPKKKQSSGGGKEYRNGPRPPHQREEASVSAGPPHRRQRMNPRDPNNCARTSPPRNLGAASTSARIQRSGPPGKPSSNPRSAPNSPNNSEDEGGELEPVEKSKEEIEGQFEECLKTKGFRIKVMQGDGACLFRAVADQIYGDPEMHGNIRELCMDYMEKNRDYFSQFVTEDFSEYITRKRADHVHGNHVEIQAMAEVFSRPVHVYQYSVEPINTFQTAESASNPPIRVSYHGGVHYNSVVDPYAATIGVGLGLPSFHPGLAEKNLMTDASQASEADDIERTMLEDKLRASDREATEEKIDEQHSRSLTACASAGPSGVSAKGVSPKPRSRPNSKPNSPQARNPTPSPTTMPPSSTQEGSASGGAGASGGEASSAVPKETASIMNNLSPSLFGLEDWGGEEDLLQQVMVLSQQEYLNSLKQHHHASTSASSPYHPHPHPPPQGS